MSPHFPTAHVSIEDYIWNRIPFGGFQDPEALHAQEEPWPLETPVERLIKVGASNTLTPGTVTAKGGA